MLAAAWLFLCVGLLGLLVFPLSAYLFPTLPARGWPLSRIIGLLLLAYCSWLLAVVFPSRSVFGAALLAIAIPCALLWALSWRRLLAVWENRTLLLQSELLFLGCFVVFCLLRGFTGDLTTGEKYMDMGFINSIALKPQVPPRDMWFAGQPINYYYLGHWLFASLSIVSTIDSVTVAGLALPLIAALYIQLSWFLVQACLGATRGLMAAALVVWFIVLNGTPGATANIVAAAGDPRIPLVSQANFLAPTQQIVDPAPIAGPTNTEFPAVSLLLGDFHAHIVGIPVVLLSIALLVQRLRTAESRRGESRAYRVVWYIAFAVLLGCHYAINSLDVPLVAGLFILTEAALALQASGSALRRWGLAALRSGATLAGSLLAIWPFHAAFRPFVLPTEQTPFLVPLPWPLRNIFAFTPVATQLGQFLALTGFILAIIATVYLVQLLSRRRPAGVWLLWLSGLPFLWWRPIFVVLVPLLLLSLFFIFTAHDATRIAYGLVAVALVLWLAPDVIMIRDLTERRMNTVFKWYLQANVLQGIAIPVLVVATARSTASNAKWLLYAAMGSAVVLGSVYVPVAVAYVVRDNGSRWWGLDGLAQLEALHPDQAAAIRWLRQQSDSDGVLEIVGKRTEGVPERLRPSHVSAYTGRPTILGWHRHVILWHNLVTAKELQRTLDNAWIVQSRAYQGDVNSVQAACTLGDVRYIYYGSYEKRPTEGELDLAALPAGLTPVFETPGVTIYRCPALTAAISPVLALYSEERSDFGRSYWLKSSDAKLRVYSETPGIVMIETRMFSVQDGLRVELRGNGQSGSWTVASQRRGLRLLLPVAAGVSEWDLVVNGEPATLGPGDPRKATIGIHTLNAAYVGEAEAAAAAQNSATQ